MQMNDGQSLGDISINGKFLYDEGDEKYASINWKELSFSDKAKLFN